jgi:hypothetical protein
VAHTLPCRTRTYRHHHLDSTRWDAVRHRPGDIVVSTSAKAGTTWMQRILSAFLYQGSNGRWRNAVTPDDLALYDAVTLDPALRAWLEGGRLAAGGPSAVTAATGPA